MHSSESESILVGDEVIHLFRSLKSLGRTFCLIDIVAILNPISVIKLHRLGEQSPWHYPVGCLDDRSQANPVSQI